MANTVFITGATGSVGSHFAARILERDADTRLILLIRGECTTTATVRFERILNILAPDMDLSQARDRVTILPGDITHDRLGLSRSVVSMLAPQITHIVHAAATTQFHLPLACARLVNYTGTRNVLAFAHDVREFGCLRHVAHISTAYVCGTRCGRIAEGDATAGATACSNSYEQSKCEAEGLARAAMRELPVSIFRPSIVVGDSQTGRATAFNALYAPLRLIQRGLISALPAFPGIPVDVVPTDYTSEVLRHILLQARAVPGMTYHLVAGPDRSSTVAEIIGEAIHHFNRHTTGTLIPPVQFIPPELWGTLHHHDDTARSSPAKAVGIYAPYTCLPRSFDDRNTRQALKGTSIRPPRLMDYYDRILEYCLKTAWGRTLRRAA